MQANPKKSSAINGDHIMTALKKQNGSTPEMSNNS